MAGLSRGSHEVTYTIIKSSGKSQVSSSSPSFSRSLVSSHPSPAVLGKAIRPSVKTLTSARWDISVACSRPVTTNAVGICGRSVVPVPGGMRALCFDLECCEDTECRVCAIGTRRCEWEELDKVESRCKVWCMDTGESGGMRLSVNGSMKPAGPEGHLWACFLLKCPLGLRRYANWDIEPHEDALSSYDASAEDEGERKSERKKVAGLTALLSSDFGFTGLIFRRWVVRLNTVERVYLVVMYLQ